MLGPHNRKPVTPSGATRRTALGLILGAPLLGACAGVQQSLGQFSNPFSSSQPDAGPAGPQQQPLSVGTGQVKVGLILPLSAAGNAGVAAQSMKNAAEMALAEFQNPNVQLLIKDDGGSPQGAQQGTQQALAEGAEIILGPLFAASVPATAQLTRTRGTSVIAFSTDSSVAGRGVYLLSFLPESDINRIIDYAAGTGKRSFAALVPDNAYGNVVEAAFKQAVGRKGGRVIAFEKYAADRSTAARTVAAALGSADALMIADDGESVVATADALTAAGANLRNIQLLGTGLWDNPRVFASPVLQGGLYAAPDPSGFRSFTGRYRTKFGGEPVRTATLAYDAVALIAALSRTQGPQRFAAETLTNPSGFAGRYRAKYGGEPVRTATLAYDAVALIAALSRTQGPQRFAAETLTNPSGFAGIDGLFRFRSDGTNERGLAVMKVATGGGVAVAGSPKSFGA